MLWRKPELLANLLARWKRRRERVHDWNARDHDAVACDALPNKDLDGFRKRHKPAIGTRARSPESMCVKICDNNAKRPAPLTTFNHAVQKFSGEKVCADNGVWLLIGNESSHPSKRKSLQEPSCSPSL